MWAEWAGKTKSRQVAGSWILFVSGGMKLCCPTHRYVADGQNWQDGPTHIKWPGSRSLFGSTGLRLSSLSRDIKVARGTSKGEHYYISHPLISLLERSLPLSQVVQAGTSGSPNSTRKSKQTEITWQSLWIINWHLELQPTRANKDLCAEPKQDECLLKEKI